VKSLRLAFLAAAAALLLAARPAAAGPSFGLGADYLTDPSAAAFELVLAADTRVARGLTVGGRIGALLATGGIGPGVPIDARLRLRLDRLYVDGLVGPWVFFGDGDSVRLHAAIGFGVVRRGVQLGLEVGWVDPSAMVGVRVAWPF
jgi:hypothetical protein